MMKAMLKISRPWSRPPSSGVMASRIDTAPRRPTQEMKAVSARGKRNGNRQSQTASGRATKIRNRPSSDRAEQDRRELRRRREQAEHQEHDDLRQPRHAVLEALQDRRRRGSWNCRRRGRRDRRRGSRSRRCAPAAAKTSSDSVSTKIGSRPLVEIEPVDEPHDGEAAAQCRRPRRAPSETRKPTTRSSDQHLGGRVGAGAIISTSVMVRKMAIGSLVPDSISSVERARGRAD